VFEIFASVASESLLVVRDSATTTKPAQKAQSDCHQDLLSVSVCHLAQPPFHYENGRQPSSAPQSCQVDQKLAAQHGSIHQVLVDGHLASDVNPKRLDHSKLV